MIRLTDEENPYPYNPEPTFNLPNTGYNAFNVGAKAQLKKVVEELKKEDARMYTGTLDNPDMLILKVHKDFWQALLEEVKE